MEFVGFKSSRAALGEIEIAYCIGGSGPPLLLLHGFPQNKSMWARIAPQLARHYTVVAADLRGYGDSSKPRDQADHSNYSFRAFAEDQLGLMRSLGFERFHLVGHDRGGRTAHRMALDHPEAVRSLTVMDIVPTLAMFMDTNRQVAATYWHWYFLQQPEPFPERLIGQDPDYFYETCLLGWGKTRLDDFDPAMLADYRRCWHDPAMIHGSCSDYRAAATVDLALDQADAERRVECPTLVFHGTAGVMTALFDIPAEWRKRCRTVQTASLPGGHFFADQFPDETAAELLRFLGGVCEP
ncbi:alpha/beta fold hydrolase [Roseateles sp. DB2]|uniref:alpha/beta fold hydrolase n=1 Tax=Roseateles sp. DB2 TaxID=3453717 RepID=UPI003EEBB1C0